MVVNRGIVLTNEEYIQLISKYREGDSKAGEEVFINSYSLVENIASNRLPNSNFDYALLLRIGKQGLWDAIKDFNLSGGNFRNFANICISKKIDSFLEKNQYPSVSAYDNNMLINISNAFSLAIKNKEYLELRYVIEMLPIRVKRLLSLKYDKCLSDSKISELLGVDENAINQALDKVKELLEQKFSIIQVSLNKEELKEGKVSEVIKPLNLQEEPTITPDAEQTKNEDIAIVEESNTVETAEEEGKSSDEEVPIVENMGIVNETDLSLSKDDSEVGKSLGEITKTTKYDGTNETTRGLSKSIKENFQDNFPGHDIDELKLAVQKLRKKHKELTYKIFGENLDTYHELSWSEQNVFKKTVIKNVLKILNGEVLVKPITERFPGYSVEELKCAINSIKNIEYQKITYEIFGENLDGVYAPEKINIFNPHIRPLIKYYLAFAQFKIKGVMPITVYFEGKSIDEIRNGVFKLSPTYRNLLLRIYGDSLESLNLYSEDELENIYVAIQMLSKALNGEIVLTGRKPLPITSFVSGNIEDIREVSSKLPDDLKIILFKRCGQSLLECNQLDSSESVLFKRKIIPLIQNMLINKNKENMIDSVNIDSIARALMTIMDAQINISKDELMIFLWRIALIDEDGPYNISDLTSYFKMSEDEINATAKSVLIKLGHDFDNIYENILRSFYSSMNQKQAYGIRFVAGK